MVHLWSNLTVSSCIRHSLFILYYTPFSLLFFIMEDNCIHGSGLPIFFQMFCIFLFTDVYDLEKSLDTTYALRE